MANCFDCNEPYGSSRFPDMLIPTLAWLRISPTGGEGGLLCPNCIISRLEIEGLEHVPHWFASGPLCQGDESEPAWLVKERLLRLEDQLLEKERGQ